jgi:hypothetical protein
MNFPREKAQVPQGNICSKFFSNHSLPIYIYKLMAYHWKGLKKFYNFVVGSTSIRTHMKKLCSHKVLNTFAPRVNMAAP